jgi:hypothetical protein
MGPRKRWATIGSDYDNGFRHGIRKAAKLIQDYARHYPSGIWPDANPDEQMSPDRASAIMARHLCGVLHGDILELCPDTGSGDAGASPAKGSE